MPSGEHLFTHVEKNDTHYIIHFTERGTDAEGEKWEITIPHTIFNTEREAGPDRISGEVTLPTKIELDPVR